MADMFGMVQNWWDPEGQDDREAQARRDAVIESAKQDKALRRQQMAFGLPYTGMAPAMLAASNAAQDHVANLGNAVNGVNSAISTEMQSRVAQAREARRMEHERQLKQMDLDALLMRLRAAQQMSQPRSWGMGTTRTFRNGGWEYS